MVCGSAAAIIEGTGCNLERLRAALSFKYLSPVVAGSLRVLRSVTMQKLDSNYADVYADGNLTVAKTNSGLSRERSAALGSSFFVLRSIKSPVNDRRLFAKAIDDDFKFHVFRVGKFSIRNWRDV